MTPPAVPPQAPAAAPAPLPPAPPSLAGLDPAQRELVANEQLRMVLAHTRAGTLMATALALLLAVYLHGSVPLGLVGAWVAAKVLLAATRVGVDQLHVARGRPGGPRWRRLIYALLGLDGLVWGVAGWWMMREPVTVASLVAAALACVSCVATFGLQARLVATAAYVVPILLPTSLGLVLRGDDFGLIGGSCLPLLLVLQLLTSASTQQRFAAGVLVRLQAQALAQDKAAALQLAQRQSEVKTQFLANISHELRTPLHGILGLARLLHVDARDRTAAHRVELIEASATHLLGLINDLLDVSRIETGHFPIRQERFDLVTQVGMVAGVFTVRARDKGLRFRMSHDFERPSWVLGDAARLRQVLHNLLGNALKFTQHGSIELHLKRADTPGMVRIEVTDTGVGIPAGDLAHVFQAFYQSGQDGRDGRESQDGHGAAPLSSGAGLGLTIARELAQAMGGDITVSSQPGRGSTFVFTARMPACDAPTEEADATGELPAGPAPIGLRNVLVVEDDDVNALIIGAYLEQLGLGCERVCNGKEAVGRALREIERPELILMDCRMPVMDGLAATREIRRQEQTLELPRVPVIALTAASSAEDRQRCAAAGMDDFIAKPFTREELTRVLAQWGGAAPVRAAGVAGAG
jgi:signal transduction histidine kinase/ActR/RegA family two-component response regulator